MAVALPTAFDDVIEFSAAPVAVRTALERLVASQPGALEWLEVDSRLLAAFTAVCGASRSMAVQVERSPAALSVLADLATRPSLMATEPRGLAEWKALEHLRIAARDLLDLDPLPETIRLVSELARDITTTAHRLTDRDDCRLAIVAMGKFGGHELNYSSDIDVMFVGDGSPGELERWARRLMDAIRPSFRVDLNLRPQGRDGPLVRTVGSYGAYWDRWAEPWEFQALLKARPVAGDAELGQAFLASATDRLWARSFSADDLRQLRHLKARVEADLARQGLTDREVKRGRGGIRDIEFAVQLLQLVHGRADSGIRAPATLTALAQLAEAGYVDPSDVDPLVAAYVFLRRLEHRLQLYDGTQVYAMPADEPSRLRIARTMGYRDASSGTALEQLDAELGRHQGTVRGIHERLYFRPLLEAFAGADAELLARPGAIDERLAAFGFSDGRRTRAAVRELTRGLTRSSRLMQQLLPLLLGWLSESPDPDLGLLNLRNLVGDPQRAELLTRSFRESPDAARRLCRILATSRLAADVLRANADLVERLPDEERLRTQSPALLTETARLAVGWRTDPADQQAALRRWKERHLFGVVARDLEEWADARQVGSDVTALAEASISVALELQRPAVPVAVISLGRFGGRELSYASDLDVVVVYDGTGADAAEEGVRVAAGVRRFLHGATPAHRLWEVDLDLRPEGKQGPIARSLEGYRAYFGRWAHVWERQAMLRARFVAGDATTGAAFADLLEGFVWAPGLSDDDRREIRRIKARVEKERLPAGDDPAFHLKLGKGSLADVEWTAQILQLHHGVRATGTLDALDALVAGGVMPPADAAVLEESYRFCETTRNRLFLVRSAPGDALPTDPNQLLWLARSLEVTPSELRERYRRVTRRARGVVERLFYGRD